MRPPTRQLSRVIEYSSNRTSNTVKKSRYTSRVSNLLYRNVNGRAIINRDRTLSQVQRTARHVSNKSMRSLHYHRVANRLQRFLQVTMVGHRFIRLPVIKSRRQVRRAPPQANTTRYKNLHGVTRGNRQAQQTATSRRTPVRNNRFLDFVSGSVPVYPFAIYNNTLHNRFHIRPISVISRRLQDSSTKTSTDLDRHVLHRLLLLNTLNIRHLLTNSHFKIKTGRFRNFVRRQGVTSNGQQPFKTGRYFSVTFLGP